MGRATAPGGTPSVGTGGAESGGNQGGIGGASLGGHPGVGGSASGGAAVPASPVGSGYELAFHDEFDGSSLDPASFRERTGARLGTYQAAKNVTVQGGRLHVRVAKETYVDSAVTPPVSYAYTSGGIISKVSFGYGYFESRGRLYGAGGGVHSSFWLMADGRTPAPKYNTTIEFDGYEVDSAKPSGFGYNYHQYINGHTMFSGAITWLSVPALDSSAADFVFGFEWLPDECRWFRNGALVAKLATPPWYSPSGVWLTALLTNAFGAINEAALPGESSWDYFRYFHKPLIGVNLIANPSFEYNQSSVIATTSWRDVGFPVGWLVDAGGGGTAKRDLGNAADGESYLYQVGKATGASRVWQDIPYPAAGTYTFSARIQRSAAHQGASVVISRPGTTDITLPLPASATAWTTVSLPAIEVSHPWVRIAVQSSGLAGEWLKVDQLDFHQVSASAGR